MSLTDYALAGATFGRHLQCLADGEADRERQENEKSMRKTKGRRR